MQFQLKLVPTNKLDMSLVEGKVSSRPQLRTIITSPLIKHCSRSDDKQPNTAISFGKVPGLEIKDIETEGPKTDAELAEEYVLKSPHLIS